MAKQRIWHRIAAIHFLWFHGWGSNPGWFSASAPVRNGFEIPTHVTILTIQAVRPFPDLARVPIGPTDPASKRAHYAHCARTSSAYA